MIRDAPPLSPPPSQRRASITLDVIAVVAVLAIAGRLAADHAAWVALDARPALDEDSAFHTERILVEYAAFFDDPGPSTVFPVGNYPPLLSWAVWIRWGLAGITRAGYFDAQVAFTAAIALGTAAMAWRAYGRAAAVGAAGLAVIAPQLYLQRSNVMLALAVTGGLAVFYATVPLKLDRPRWAATIGGGIAGGIALLGHLSAVYFVAATGLGVVLHYTIEVARDRTRLRVALARLFTWAAAAFAVCGAYYARSLPVILYVLDQHDEKYGSEMVPSSRLYFLVRLKQGFFLGEHQTAVVVGLVASLALAWWRPAVRVYLVAAVGGFLGIIGFPQAHDRYLLPLVPLLGVCAFAPLGLLAWRGPGRLAREVVALVLGGWAASRGLAYSAASFGPLAPTASETAAVGPYASLHPYSPGADLQAALLAPPPRRPWAGPHPHYGSGAEPAVLAAMLADSEKGPIVRYPERVQIVGYGRPTPAPGLALDLLLLGEPAEAPFTNGPRCLRRRCYVVVTDRMDRAADPLPDLGYQPVEADLPEGTSLWVQRLIAEVPRDQQGMP